MIEAPPRLQQLQNVALVSFLQCCDAIAVAGSRSLMAGQSKLFPIRKTVDAKLSSVHILRRFLGRGETDAGASSEPIHATSDFLDSQSAVKP